MHHLFDHIRQAAFAGSIGACVSFVIISDLVRITIKHLLPAFFIFEMALSTMALLIIYSYVSLFFFVKIFGGLNRIRSYFHDFIMDQLVEVVRLAGGQQLNSSVAVVIIL